MYNEEDNKLRFVGMKMKVKIGDLTKIRTGKLDANASSEEGQYPFFTCSREPLKISTYSYDCECVLVAGNGDLNVKYYNGKFDAYQRTYIIEDNGSGKLFMPYLYYFMEGYIEELRKQAIGGVIKYIKLGNLTDALIKLPSIEEQKAIVDVLEKAKTVLDIRNAQIKKLDELIKARFVELFGNPVSNPKGWERVTVDECVDSIDNGKSFVCDSMARIGEEPAILKLSAATYGVYKPEENKAIINGSDFIKGAEVHSGDLLFTRKNTPELVGMAAYVFTTPKKLMMPDLIFRINTKQNCRKIYLWKLINHELFRSQIQSLASGSAKSMSNISKERLGKLHICLPPLDLQIEFEEFVIQINKSKVAVQKALDEAQLLFDSLMQEYFG